MNFFNDLPDDQRASYAAAMILIAIIGIMGLLAIGWLMRAWRRHTERLGGSRRQDASMPDIWKESGDRLLSKMSPYPRGDVGSDEHLDDDPPFDPYDDEPDDDDDDPARW
mgnify:CR=1 FL=1